MDLFVPQMDATVVEVADDGRVRYADGEWATPTLQERRAIIYAAQQAIDELTDIMRALELDPPPA
jgi:acyl-CoA reductase-like NAD-dependent aldehyde dehydrogenase